MKDESQVLIYCDIDKYKIRLFCYVLAGLVHQRRETIIKFPHFHMLIHIYVVPFTWRVRYQAIFFCVHNATRNDSVSLTTVFCRKWKWNWMPQQGVEIKSSKVRNWNNWIHRSWLGRRQLKATCGCRYYSHYYGIVLHALMQIKFSRRFYRSMRIVQQISCMLTSTWTSRLKECCLQKDSAMDVEVLPVKFKKLKQLWNDF